MPSMSIISQTPQRISAGDTAQWLVTAPDFPASAGWTLKYTFINALASINVTSSASGDDHQFNISAATTAAWASAVYSVVAYVTNVGGQRFSLETGNITIEPNLAGAASGLDIRSAAQKCLDALDAALSTYGNKAYTQEYEIAGRRMKFTSLSDFMKARSLLQSEVRREQAALKGQKGMLFGPKVLVEYR